MLVMEDKIKELYENGFNFKQIGLNLNKDPRSISKIVKNNGYKQKIVLRNSKYGLNENYLDNASDRKFWFLGLMAADGFIINENSFGISQSGFFGYQLIGHLKEELKYGGPIYSGETIGENYYNLTITSNHLVKKMSEYNIVNKKSLIYEFPILNNVNEVRDFIRGYVDGDGSVGIYNNGSGHKYIVVSFVGTKNFIVSASKKIPIKSSSIRKLVGENCYEIRWYGKKAIKFCEWVYSNNSLYEGYKQNKFMDYLKTHTPNFLKYEIKKEEVKKLLNDNIKVSEIVKITDIPFQTIYKWKKEF
jgi:hypothetical protein